MLMPPFDRRQRNTIINPPVTAAAQPSIVRRFAMAFGALVRRLFCRERQMYRMEHHV